MKIKYLYIIALKSFVAAIFVMTACQKDEDTLAQPRLFKPQVSVDNSVDNQLLLSWMGAKGAVRYKVEVSRDTFKTIDKAYLLEAESTSLTVDSLLAAQDYNIRVKSIHADSTLNSKYYVLSAATRSIFISPTEILDIGFRAKWEARGTPVSSIQLIRADNGELAKEVVVNPQEAIAHLKEISGLKGGVKYEIRILSGSLLRGKGFVTTKPALSNAIDLRYLALSDIDLVFNDTITKVPDGAVIVLKRGVTYNLNVVLKFSKSITFTSGYDYITDLAILNFKKNFDLTNGGNVPSVVFRDLYLKGDTNNAYLLLSSASTCTVGEIKFENCRISTFRGVIRIQSAETINNLTIDKCTIDSLVRDYGITRLYQTTTHMIYNINLKNSTLYNVTRIFQNTKYMPNTPLALNIENCTFYKSPLSGNYLIDYGTDATLKGTVLIKNCIFSAIGGSTSGSGYRMAPNVSTTVQNSYKTSDFSVTNSIPDLTNYSSSSAILFTDPANANFKIKDPGFAGKTTAGDPKWR